MIRPLSTLDYEETPDGHFRLKQSPRPGTNGAHTDDPAASEHLTDLGNARRLVALHGRDLRYCHPWQKWLVWDTRRWLVDDTAEVLRRGKATVANIYKEAAEASDATQRKALADHGKRSEAEARIKAMISLAESEPGIPVRPDDLDTNLWLLNVTNGTLDLETGELQAHNPDDLITKIAPVAFDADAKCPIWDAFLERILPAAKLRSFLQRLVGYSMTGLTTEQIIAFLIGNGANGKSTLIETFQSMLGDYAKTAAPGMLLTSRGDRHPTELADLHGARFVSTVEVGEGRRLKEDLIKQLTGGDTIKCRRMHENFWEFTPTHQLFIAANLKPEIRGADVAIWRRIVVVPFDVTIPPTEQDKNLAQKLKAELPAILAWAVGGCLAWQSDGLGASTEVAAATANYRVEQDALALFLEERCIEGDGLQVRAASAFKAYISWATAQGFSDRERLSGNDFGGRMRARFESKKGSTGRFYHGVGLIAQGSTPQEETEPVEKTWKEASPASPNDGTVTAPEPSVEESHLSTTTQPHVEKTLKHASPAVTRHPQADLCLGAARTLDFPEIELGPGVKVAPGEASWIRFTERNDPGTVEEAQTALDRMGGRGHDATKAAPRHIDG